MNQSRAGFFVLGNCPEALVLQSRNASSLVRAVTMSRQRLIRGRHNPPCCGKVEGSVACFPFGDRTVTLLVFLAAAAWAWVVPSDLR
jgi:hypothetical protein